VTRGRLRSRCTLPLLDWKSAPCASKRTRLDTRRDNPEMSSIQLACAGVLSALVVVVVACGNDPEPNVSSRGLPTRQLALLGHLCPTTGSLYSGTAAVRGAVHVDRRRAQHERDNLIALVQKRPDGRVRTTYLDHNAGLQHETLTIRTLVQRHLATLPETIQVGDERSRACARREAAHLRAAMK
jgi:hypothetical protein